MITAPSSLEELKELYLEQFLDNTDKVTKISPGSVNSGIAYGVAKIGQKALKDIALIESNLFPESAFGTALDRVAERYGISPRQGALGSSSYIRLVGNPGTLYQKNIHSFISTSGISFQLEKDITLGINGYTYAKVRSQSIGSESNVSALSITKMNSSPTGHKYSINEYQAIGGRDAEDDDAFLKRIKEGASIYSNETVSKLTQVFNKINPNVLRVIHGGIGTNGENLLYILTQNGIDLSEAELNQILVQGRQYLGINEITTYEGENRGIILKNVSYFPIDISFQVELDIYKNSDDIRKEIQILLSKYLDYRFWTSDKKVEWDDLLNIVKSVSGVKYIQDQTFTPRLDIKIPRNQFPRIRGFIMLDLSGNIIADISGYLNPTYYPFNPNFFYHSTILRDII